MGCLGQADAGSVTHLRRWSVWLRIDYRYFGERSLGRNILIQIMSSSLAENAWPAPLAHCGKLLVDAADDRVTIAEITSEPVNGYPGTRMLFTALVPMEELDAVMNSTDGLGHGIRTSSGGRAFAADGTHSPSFWVYGLQSTKSFESLVNHWENHNKDILWPDNAFLMNFNLMPRFLGNEVVWDDYDLPLHDVVRSTPVSTYEFSTGHSTARISVRRDYLDRYLTQKQCAAVVTYFDERFSTGDAEVEALIKAGMFSFKQSGRELWFKTLRNLPYEQVSQVWGSAVLLKPSGNAALRDSPPELKWPGRAKPVKADRQGGFEPMETVFVKDEVLIAFEDKPEYEIHATRGSVGYQNRWSVGYCHRIGRNHIELELRKLYEGAPGEIIVHVHQYAVEPAVANKDEHDNGKRNVGERAKELIYAYLELTRTLTALSSALGLPVSQEDICKCDLKQVEYRGWWMFPGLTSLGNVIPIGMTNSAFLDRCKNIYSVFEDLQQAPLRRMAIQLGLDKDVLAEFKSLRLLSLIAQMAHLAIDGGFNLISDAPAIAKLWTAATPRPKELDSVFALHTLRVSGAHNLTGKKRTEYLDALKIFGIDEKQCAAGWGLSLDKVYEALISALQVLNDLILEASGLG